MKKYLSILGFALLFSSCGYFHTPTVEEINYYKKHFATGFALSCFDYTPIDTNRIIEVVEVEAPKAFHHTNAYNVILLDKFDNTQKVEVYSCYENDTLTVYNAENTGNKWLYGYYRYKWYNNKRFHTIGIYTDGVYYESENNLQF